MVMEIPVSKRSKSKVVTSATPRWEFRRERWRFWANEKVCRLMLISSIHAEISRIDDHRKGFNFIGLPVERVSEGIRRIRSGAADHGDAHGANFVSLGGAIDIAVGTAGDPGEGGGANLKCDDIVGNNVGGSALTAGELIRAVDRVFHRGAEFDDPIGGGTENGAQLADAGIGASSQTGGVVGIDTASGGGCVGDLDFAAHGGRGHRKGGGGHLDRKSTRLNSSHEQEFVAGGEIGGGHAGHGYQFCGS